ncbi:hypothetical protein P152DRAFT_469457 [Eremomyces bilateralis CBS 781.70]|uniref:Uncharacterized protein n=1 Tax=Eremomyces bilateralis CBS 781.70 TaxID=1392243 RepID=A0A6G1GFT3_9PEZI|nr:uncharacterized protein P152DRAFT_469457 [Eremomyces bilateralis CBS 781.70]KAF1816947.1 hypothetical protein P152DRAFT_469457 [Eremomyces bilateralis CBS 781.70]
MASSSNRALSRTLLNYTRVGSRASVRYTSSQSNKHTGSPAPVEQPKQDKKTIKQSSAAKGESAAKEPDKKPKTQAELDAALREKLSGMAGDGGESGVEYEDGKPVSMKRGVRNNMFRYI